MLTDILDQRERLINQHWRRDLEVHMNLYDYARLLAETGVDYYFEHRPGCSRIYGMEIVIDGSEKPCVKVAEDRTWI